MIAAVTGHRPHKLGHEYDHRGPYSLYITSQFKELIDSRNITVGVSGMALGADTLWAASCIKNGINVIAAIPFLGQESMWPKKSQQLYHGILQHPLVTTTIVCGGDYRVWKMQKRNVWMVDKCDILIAVWDGSKGGTYNTIKYAEKNNIEIIRINPSQVKI